jgi:ATP-dependent helicase/nuclease subunit B
VARIVTLAESLAADDGQGLWSGAPGLQASELLAELIRESAGFSISGTHEISDILSHLINQGKVRTGGNTHPRLLILGAIEARLVKADRLILAGLEESVWPQAPALDPFLSRPMRQKLGLPTPERRTGLSAHDFVQAAAAPEVFLITRHRREGEPQVASRWLWRLQTLCDGAGLKIPTDDRYLDWARAMDAGLKLRPQALKPAVQPEPRPPVSVRPTQMSVTEVEVFVRDPYAIYAKRILKLRPLERPNEPVEARQRGTAIHKGLERFVTEKVPLGEEGVHRLTAMLEAELQNANLAPDQLALQRPLLPGMAREFVTFEQSRRINGVRYLIEESGALVLHTALGGFRLTAQADRIEIREGSVDIIDFKTGGHATIKQVVNGFYPQLTLTGAILRQGGFAAAKPAAIGDMIYVKLSPDAVKTTLISDKGRTSDDLAAEALDVFSRRIDQFADPEQGYKSWRAPQYRNARGGDYDHLARLYEWSVLGDTDPADTGEADA